MTKRICWKKGMRLTDDILRASDNSTVELVSKAFVLATAGRFGLFPSSVPFELSLNVTNNIVDVLLLHCLAITKGGHLIDVNYDTNYTNTFDTRVQIPEGEGEKEYILTINALSDSWKDTNDGYEEPVYSFSLLPSNSPVPNNSLPIARIVNEYGWRMDDIDFVPPCLFVSSHQKYQELLERFVSILSEINRKTQDSLNSRNKSVISVFWPILQQIIIATDKGRDAMTPLMLLENIQKCISAFTCACDLDEHLELTDAEDYRNYSLAPYNNKNIYQQIREGLDFCFAISEKIEKLQGGVKVTHKTPLALLKAPTIDRSQLVKKCTNSKVRIQIVNNEPRATVFYTTNDEEPTEKSKSGLVASIDSGFSNSRRREPDKTITVKVKAFLNGACSDTNTYEITLQKDIERWTGIEI